MRFALIPNCVTRAGDGLLTVRFTESMNEIRPRSARQYSSTEKITGFNSDLIKWCCTHKYRFFMVIRFIELFVGTVGVSRRKLGYFEFPARLARILTLLTWE